MKNFGQWLLENKKRDGAQTLELRAAFDAGQQFMKERMLEEIAGLACNFLAKAVQRPDQAPGWKVSAEAIKIAGQHLEKNLDVN